MTVRLSAAGRIAIVALLLTVLGPVVAGAVEPSKEFLAGLRERGLHDYAVLYLEQMRKSPLASPAFQQTVDLELAVTLADGARLATDPAARDEELRRALTAFDKCLAAGGESFAYRGAALRSKGKTQLALAASLIAQADRPTNKARKGELVEAARKLFGDGGKSFSEATAFYHRRKDELAKSTAADKKELEEERKAGVLEALLLEATADLELGKTFEAGSTDGKQVLARGAERFGYLAEQYRRFLAGQLATVRQAECYELLGEADKALGAIEPIVGGDDGSPEGKQVTAEATQLFLKIATSDGQKKYLEAIELGNNFATRATDDKAENALAVEYYTAIAYQKLATSAKKEDPAARKNIGEARKRARHVARFNGPFQQRAQQLVNALGRGDAAPESGEPQTFAAARAKADLARDAWQVAEQAARLAKNGGDASVAQAQEDEAENQRVLAFEGYQRALRLADAQTPAADLTQVRYTLAFLFWDFEHFEEAAVLGEHVARGDAKHPLAPKAAQIALAAYQKLLQAAPEGERKFAERGVQSLANHMLVTWPDKPEADTALLTMFEAAIASGEAEAAIAQLDKIPEDSPRRAVAELRAGQILWNAYRRAQAAGDQAKQDPETLRLAAQKTLEAGYNRARARNAINAASAGGAIALAQLYFDAGHPDKAVPIVEDSKLGLLTLVKQLPADSPLVMEVYKSALQGYVSAKPPRLEEAEKTMNSLDALAAKDAKAAALLTRVYVGLGRELHAQIKSLSDRGDQEQADNVARSLEAFLERVGARKEGQNYQTLSWIAETYYNLAGGGEALGRASPAAAKQFAKAAGIYQQLLVASERDPAYLPKPELAKALRLRMAQCQRRAGNYQAATDVLVPLLEAEPMLVVAQAEAARILQDRGNVEDTKYFDKAIAGDLPRGKVNLIWGWGRLAQLVAKQKTLSDTFHEARINLTTCRYLKAQRSDPTLRAELLKRAKTDIVMMTKLYADLGGPVWRARYDALLKLIQKDLNEPAVGLSAIAPLPGPMARGAAAAPTDTSR
ncbi:MAG: hypothetical protein U0836_06215 [Pirellulales bacterium]